MCNDEYSRNGPGKSHLDGGGSAYAPPVAPPKKSTKVAEEDKKTESKGSEPTVPFD